MSLVLPGSGFPLRNLSSVPPGCPTPQCPQSAVAPHFCSCCQRLLSSYHHKCNDVPIVSWLCSREGLGWGRVQPNLLPAHTTGVRSEIPLGASEQCLGHFWYRQQFGKTLLPPCCSHRNYRIYYFFKQEKAFPFQCLQTEPSPAPCRRCPWWHKLG